MTLCVIHHINWPFWPVDIGCAVLPAWLSCPLPAALSGSPLRGHRRVFHADGHAVFKVRCWFCNKKSPHNNLNLTVPSGMALVRIRYVAIRKLKTCSDSFGSRAGILSKYVFRKSSNSFITALKDLAHLFWSKVICMRKRYIYKFRKDLASTRKTNCSGYVLCDLVCDGLAEISNFLYFVLGRKLKTNRIKPVWWKMWLSIFPNKTTQPFFLFKGQ